MALKLLAFFGTKQTLAWASRSSHGARPPGGTPAPGHPGQACPAVGYAGLAAALALALALGNCDLPPWVGRGRSRSLPCRQVSMETAWGHLFHPPPQAAAEILLQIFTTRSKRRQPLGAVSRPPSRGKALGCGRVFCLGTSRALRPGWVSSPCSLGPTQR